MVVIRNSIWSVIKKSFGNIFTTCSKLWSFAFKIRLETSKGSTGIPSTYQTLGLSRKFTTPIRTTVNRGSSHVYQHILHPNCARKNRKWLGKWFILKKKLQWDSYPRLCTTCPALQPTHPQSMIIEAYSDWVYILPNRDLLRGLVGESVGLVMRSRVGLNSIMILQNYIFICQWKKNAIVQNSMFYVTFKHTNRLRLVRIFAYHLPWVLSIHNLSSLGSNV